MRLHPQQRFKLGRILRYVGAAMIAAWSLVALATYAGVEAIVAWGAGQAGTEGPIATLLSASAAVDGPLVAGIWAVGTVLIVVLTFGIHRIATALR